MNTIKKVLVGLVLSSALVGHAMASVLVSNAPAPGAAYGQSSDQSGAYRPQTFVASTGTVLESITWWGYRIQEPDITALDDFAVTLDGVEQTGVLSISTFGNYLEYTLDITDAVLASSSLGIVNNSPDFQWYWQSAQGIGTTLPDADAVSFRLNGFSGQLPPPQDVPEPTSFSLILLALGGLALRQAQSKK